MKKSIVAKIWSSGRVDSKHCPNLKHCTYVEPMDCGVLGRNQVESTNTLSYNITLIQWAALYVAKLNANQIRQPIPIEIPTPMHINSHVWSCMLALDRLRCKHRLRSPWWTNWLFQSSTPWSSLRYTPSTQQPESSALRRASPSWLWQPPSLVDCSSR